MPNIWTHIMFSDKLARNVNLDYDGNENVYYLGAQGPDPFFYHNFWPWKKDKSVTEIGSKIHKEHCSEFLLEMIKYVKEINDPLLKYYMLGFVSHHVLDRNAHPYIIYKSGEESNKHQLLETTIDTILMKELYNIKTWKTPVYKKIDVGLDLPKPIINLLMHLLIDVHNDQTPNLNVVINQSYQDMIKAMRVLFDPTGIKNKLLGDLVYPYSHQKNFPQRDYLNQEHNKWLHPADQSEVSTESFYDILERAEIEGTAIFKSIIGYLNGNKSLEDVKDIISDISYETGKQCKEKLEFKYFDPIV